MQPVRHTARALIVNPAFEVLLISVDLPWLEGPVWTLPGGGIEPGESAELCARREILEETGFDYPDEMLPGWHGTIEFIHQGQTFQVHETYFVARAESRFEPNTDQMLDYEKDFTLDIDWLSIEQMQTSHCSPRQLPDMLKRIRDDQLPLESVLIENLMPDNYRPNGV